MSKSQNHTNHNQGRKNHRNGIKKPARRFGLDTQGMDKRFRRNIHRVRRGNALALRKKAEAAQK